MCKKFFKSLMGTPEAPPPPAKTAATSGGEVQSAEIKNADELGIGTIDPAAPTPYKSGKVKLGAKDSRAGVPGLNL